jgi:hypothetical protein
VSAAELQASRTQRRLAGGKKSGVETANLPAKGLLRGLSPSFAALSLVVNSI